MFLPPRIRIDVHGMTTRSKTVDESDDAGGAWKDGVPLLEREIGGDDGGLVFMPSTNDVVKQVGGAVITGEVPELIEK